MDVRKEILTRISDMTYLQSAVILLNQMLNDIHKIYALWLRLPEKEWPLETLQRHQEYDCEQISGLAKRMQEILDIVGDIYNSRDMSDVFIEEQFSEVRKQLNMLKERKIEDGE